MDLFQQDYTYTCLSFDEAHILRENYKKKSNGILVKLDQVSILARLDNLLRNTQDPYLRNLVLGLLRKVQKLTPKEYEQLLLDIESDMIVFPGGYPLPTEENALP